MYNSYDLMYLANYIVDDIMVMYCMFLQRGDTPLHDASLYGHAAADEVLLKNGAAINQTNNVSWHIIDYYFIYIHSNC